MLWSILSKLGAKFSIKGNGTLRCKHEYDLHTFVEPTRQRGKQHHRSMMTANPPSRSVFAAQHRTTLILTPSEQLMYADFQS
jgi:hypothetical protein